MKDIRIYTLFSGSGGNCHYIKCADTHLLFDAGKNAKAVCSSLAQIGADISDISSIYITHEHCDHTSALRVLKKKNPHLSLVCHPLCADAIEAGGVDMAGARYIYGKEALSEGDVKVYSFRVPHDSAACLGYRIEYNDGSSIKKIGIATDIGCLTRELADGLFGCDYVIVEANHDTDMLRTGPYPVSLKERVFSAGGHLSNEACSRLCSYLSQNGTQRFALAHISKENNTPELALRTVRGDLDKNVFFVCAAQDMPVCLFEFEGTE